MRVTRAAVLLGLLLAGCATPVTVQRLDAQSAYLRRNRSALGSDQLSETTQTVLRQHDLNAMYNHDPARAIAALHDQVVHRPEAWAELFALAETSYRLARNGGGATRYLAAALYAYAFLFPGGTEERPSPYDPMYRQACDLYNLALAAGLTSSAGDEVTLQAGRYQLPSETLDIAVDGDSLQWGGRELTGFVPTGTLKVTGLRNQYSSPGIGVLRVDSPRKQLATGSVAGTMTLFTLFDAGSVTLGNEHVPLEYDQTATRAVSLVETAIWETELSGFLRGTLFDVSQPRLVSIEPHRRGRIPVVLIHGTASNPFRWADMINDLLEDTQIRTHFEFWVFTYETGNPIPYSALSLRDALQQAVASLGGEAADPALGHIVLIGHSQGGLLAKMLTIDPGDRLWNTLSRRPLDQLKLQPESRALIAHAFFPVPVQQVDRVVFIATPQRGSYLASFSVVRLIGRLVTLPLAVSRVGAEILAGNKEALNFDPSTLRLGSIYGMSPGSPLIKALAAIPITPRVHAHSIIPVQGDGPPALGDDGVVTYESAHLDGVESELVVRSGHSAQSNPATIQEVRRILMAKLASTCLADECKATPRTLITDQSSTP
jgi:pimeloyl-ACP methyl ester carboxylesterase